MYKYEDEKGSIFTDQGNRHFIMLRDVAIQMLNETGAFISGKFIERATSKLGAINTWFALACLDRMVEIGDIQEKYDGTTRGQDRVFIKK